MKLFKVLSLLLSYPSEETKSVLGEIRALVEGEAALANAHRDGLLRFIDDYATKDLLDLQERYVLLFDRTRALSLHLFEHVHGESRDRGQAMVDLASLYQQRGLEIDARELPDYLPLFLEFLALLPEAEACELLQQPLHIVAALRERLVRRGSIYAEAFSVIEAIARRTPERTQVEEILSEEEDDPNDMSELDRIWEEEMVRFGPDSDTKASCPKVGSMLERMATARS